MYKNSKFCIVNVDLVLYRGVQTTGKQNKLCRIASLQCILLNWWFDDYQNIMPMEDTILIELLVF